MRQVIASQVPTSYINGPADLETVLNKDSARVRAPDFEDAMPVLVKHETGDVKWHVVKAKGKHYMKNGRFEYMGHLPGPEAWVGMAVDERSQELRGECVYRIDGLLVAIEATREKVVPGIRECCEGLRRSE